MASDSEAIWQSQFGREYTKRNSYSSVDEIDQKWKENIGVSMTGRISWLLAEEEIDSCLEIGCNSGYNLEIIRKLKQPRRVAGCDLELSSIKTAVTREQDMIFCSADAIDLPFRDGEFELVFTRGVLVHIPPPLLEKALSEMCRISCKYIAGMEFFAEEFEMIPYQGKDDILWKADYVTQFLKHHSELRLLRNRLHEWRYEIYKRNGLMSQDFIFELI